MMKIQGSIGDWQEDRGGKRAAVGDGREKGLYYIYYICYIYYIYYIYYICYIYIVGTFSIYRK